jgi:hypothetical protein
MAALRATMLTANLLVAACGTDPDVACTAIEQVAVTEGLTPIISWSPNCAVNGITVHVALPATKPPTDPGNGVIVGTLMWEVQASVADANTLRPPLRYGQVPPGAIGSARVEPLISGTEYVILVSVKDPEEFDSPFGYLEFVP